jgi:hypothetical protein
MRKFSLGFVALALIAVPLTLTAPANAEPIPDPIGGTIDLTVGDVRYGANGDCANAPVQVSVQTPDDWAYYEYNFTSTYDGPTTSSDEVSGSEVFSNTFNDSFLVCPSFDSPGIYMGRLEVTFYDFSEALITTAYATDSFRVSAYVAPPVVAAPPVVRHHATLSTSKIRSGAHGWTLRATTVYDNRAWRSHRVTMQVKSRGTWRNVRAVWTNSAGRANFNVIPARGRAKAYRVVSAAGTGVGAKVSGTYLLRRR